MYKSTLLCDRIVKMKSLFFFFLLNLKKNLLSDEILKKLSTKLLKEDYQRVLTRLKQASSVVGDELENLLSQLQVRESLPVLLSSISIDRRNTHDAISLGGSQANQNGCQISDLFATVRRKHR